MPCSNVAGKSFGKKWTHAFILLLLSERPSHGYDIAKRLGDFGCPKKNIAQMGGLYRNLAELENDGLIISDWDTDDNGPAKKIYKISPDGKKYLKTLSEYFDGIIDIIKDFQKRVSEIAF